MKTNTATLDVSAISLSCLCLIHCLALPFLVVLLPIAGVFAEEWVHQLLVLLALPVTMLAIVSSWSNERNGLFIFGAVCGLALLLAAAFVEALHDLEILLTTIGAVTLALAHVWRWRMRSAQSAEAVSS